MKAIFAPTASIQAQTSFATNSGPLSLRINADGPHRMKRSVSTSITTVEFSFRVIQIARQSRLKVASLVMV